MKIMYLKNVVMGLLFGIGLIVIAGCYSLPILDQPRSTNESTTVYVSVRSTPSDAEVYLNGRMLGRTPALDLPIAVSYTINKDWMNRTARVDGQYVLTVSKNGYKTEAFPLEFNGDSNGLGIHIIDPSGAFNMFREQASFNVTLKPEGGQSQTGLTNTPQNYPNEISKAEEIEKYKQLLDKEVISKDEFEQKKKQLLGL